jgi:hypothetical protein
MPSDAQINLISMVSEAAIKGILQLIDYLRERGHDAAADDLEMHLSRSDQNLKTVIARSREAQGLPPLP